MVMVFTAVLNLYGITKLISHVYFFCLLSLILLNQGNDIFNINFSMKGTKVQTLGTRAVAGAWCMAGCLGHNNNIITRSTHAHHASRQMYTMYM